MRIFSHYLIVCFLFISNVNAQTQSRSIGNKSFEVSNHLNNITEVTSDRKVATNSGSVISYNSPNVVSFTDYYPYGMQQDSRSNYGDYKYGFQGQEKEDKIKGKGNVYSTEFRLYNTRVGRWLSIDPQFKKQPSKSVYKAYHNNPIFWIDDYGNTEYENIIINDRRTGQRFSFKRVVSNDLKAKRLEVERYMSDDYAIEYDWHDLHNVTIYDINESGNLTISETTVLGKKRSHTWFENKWAAKLYAYGIDGDGGTQNGGLVLTMEGGGADPTKQKSLNPAEERDIGLLLEVLGNISGGSLGGKVPDGVKDIKGLISGGVDVNLMFQEHYQKDQQRTLINAIKGNNKVKNFWELDADQISFHMSDSYYKISFDHFGGYSVSKAKKSSVREDGLPMYTGRQEHISNEKFEAKLKGE